MDAKQGLDITVTWKRSQIIRLCLQGMMKFSELYPKIEAKYEKLSSEAESLKKNFQTNSANNSNPSGKEELTEEINTLLKTVDELIVKENIPSYPIMNEDTWEIKGLEMNSTYLTI